MLPSTAAKQKLSDPNSPLEKQMESALCVRMDWKGGQIRWTNDRQVELKSSQGEASKCLCSLIYLQFGSRSRLIPLQESLK